MWTKTFALQSEYYFVISDKYRPNTRKNFDMLWPNDRNWCNLGDEYYHLGVIFLRMCAHSSHGMSFDNSNDGLYFGGIMQERRNHIANALELRLSCTNPSCNLHTCCHIMLWSTVTVLRYVVFFVGKTKQLSQATADFFKKSQWLDFCSASP